MLSGIYLCFVYICVDIFVYLITLLLRNISWRLLTYIVVSYLLFTIVITIWLTVTKYSHLKWQWIFYFLRRPFLSSTTSKTFTWLDSITGRVSYKKQELLTLREHLSSHPGFLVESVLLIFAVFCLVLLCVFVSSVLWCPLRFQHKNYIRFVFPPPTLVCLFCVCLLCIVVSNMYWLY